jgi:hypothetical protein
VIRACVLLAVQQTVLELCAQPAALVVAILSIRAIVMQ